MITPEDIRIQVEKITTDLIKCSLCEDQKHPSCRSESSKVVVDFGESDISIVLKNRSYKEIYNELLKTQAYNIRMVDGALIQIMYRFEGEALYSHRLAFFPSPYLEEFQNNPEIYEEDCVFADVVKKNVVPFPLRFDFDKSEELFVEVEHPKSHLTLGQYKNCRVPVSAPLTPVIFIGFILRNFYNTAYKKFSSKITQSEKRFSETIDSLEKEVVYLQLP